MQQETPIIVGVGQITDHIETLSNAPHPLQYAKMTIEACVEDARCPKILEKVNALSFVNIFSWYYKDPAGMLCDMLKINPKIKEYTYLGGNTPQWLVNRAADRIAKGEIEVAVLSGSEAMFTVYMADKANYTLPWPSGESDLINSIKMIGDDRFGSNPHEILHNIVTPIQVYPLFENALRAEQGLSIEAHQRFLSDFCSGFSKIAAKNPLAWFRNERSSHEIGKVTDENRMIGFPYTKFMNPIMNVNQAASIILTSTRMAKKLSIPKHKWIYIHGGADAHDKWFLSDRINYTFSPAIKEVAEATLKMAGVDISQIDLFDLYSCFPCATLIGAKSIGLDINYLPPLTITGGLAYFGGPGNNYTMHSIAHMVERLRKNPEQRGYITGLGWHITKHSAGIYSGMEPEKPWNREGLENIQKKIDLMQGPELTMEPKGPATVETYTVIHDHQGKPDYAIIIARLEDHKRCLAQTEEDQDLLKDMEKEEFIGKKGNISPRNNMPNIMRF